MSRVGKQPISVPPGVQVSLADQVLLAKGAKGQMRVRLHTLVDVKHEGDALLVSCKRESRFARGLHGLFRTLCANAVTGVHQGFTRELELHGVGYRAQLQGKSLQLALGFSHPVVYPLPEGITAKVEGKKQDRIILEGVDKQLVGSTAAHIRAYRPVEPYRGKGIRYSDEVVVRKEGKSSGK
ncbi:MAG: 50S ribosomal protein L6 [Myxococcota bacterium]